MFYLIYKITNLLNNKIYIGQHITKNKDDDYMGSGIQLKKDIQMFGLQHFKKEILLECQNRQELNKMQRLLVDEDFVLRQDTYNLKIGGLGGWQFINKYHLNNNAEQYKKGNKKHLQMLKNDLQYAEMFWKRVRQGLQKINKEQIKQKMRQVWKHKKHPWIGRKHSEQTKKKIGQKNAISHKGILNSSYGTCWIYNLELKENKKIKKDNLEQWLKKGWEKGRKMSF